MELKQNQTQNSSDKTFLTILSDGKLHQRVDGETPGAVLRLLNLDILNEKGKDVDKDFTNSNVVITLKTGGEIVGTLTEQTKKKIFIDSNEYDKADILTISKRIFELVHTSATGMITNMYFQKGQFGENLIVEIDNDGAISFSGNQSYGEQLLRKLPNIDLAKPVTISPYNFSKNGKSNKGVTITQDEVKLQDYYFDYDKKVSQNGLPEFDGDKNDNNDWKLYFLQVNKFLKKQTQPIFEANNFKAPEPKQDSATSSSATDVADEEDDITKKF